MAFCSLLALLLTFVPFQVIHWTYTDLFCLCFIVENVFILLFWEISILFICISWTAYCVGPWVVSTQVDFTAILPCHITNAQIQTPHIRWRTDTEVVFERWNSRSYTGEGYEDRVDVTEDQLLRGNCSLILKNVRETDEGIYTSYLLVTDVKLYVSAEWSLIESVEFSVAEAPTKPPVPVNDAVMASPHPLLKFLLLLMF